MWEDRCEQLRRFYALLDELDGAIGGARRLLDCTGRMSWPTRGVYFFREAGESRNDSGSGPRVVRVGTHALTPAAGTKLWGRLSQHKGRSSSGGNHRTSIFRLLVGSALINRDRMIFPTWGKGNKADKPTRCGEVVLEHQVSRVIGDMPLLWVPIEDAAGPGSMRGYIERNAIALLSNFNKPELDPPSQNWLGRYSDRELVKASGLWNQNHVGEQCDVAFLDAFGELVVRAKKAA